MQLSQYVDALRAQLMAAAQAGGEESLAAADRLLTQLDSGTRLVLLEALSGAAAEITQDLAPGSVEVRLRGVDPEFAVSLPPVNPPHSEARNDLALATTAPPPDSDETATSRTTLRLPEQLKVRVEEAAAREGISVNAWLVRAVSAALQTSSIQGRTDRPAPPGGQHFTGWAH